MSMALMDALIPIFVGLLAGFYAGRAGFMDAGHTRNLTVVVMDFAVPCAMFLSLGDLSWYNMVHQLRAGVAFALVFGLISALCYLLARCRWSLQADEAAMLSLTVGFPNSAAVGLPLLSALYGPQAATVAALSIAVGSTTVSPLALVLLETAGAGIRLTFSSLIRGILRSFFKPVVWSPVLALLLVASGWHLPSYVTATLRMLGDAAAGSALLLTGLVVAGEGFALSAPVIWSILIKLIGQPVLAVAVGLMLRLRPHDLQAVVLVAAIPAGFFGVLFGKDLDRRSEISSSALAGSYVLSAPSIVIWAWLLSRWY